MLLQSISLLLAKTANLKIFSVFKITTEIGFPQSSIAGCYLFIEFIGFFLILHFQPKFEAFVFGHGDLTLE